MNVLGRLWQATDARSFGACCRSTANLPRYFQQAELDATRRLFFARESVCVELEHRCAGGGGLWPSS